MSSPCQTSYPNTPIANQHAFKLQTAFGGPGGNRTRVQNPSIHSELRQFNTLCESVFLTYLYFFGAPVVGSS